MDFKEETAKEILEPIQNWIGKREKARQCLVLAAESLNGKYKTVLDLPYDVNVFSYVMACSLKRDINAEQAEHLQRVMKATLLRFVEESEDIDLVSLFSLDLVAKINDRFKKIMEHLKEGEDADRLDLVNRALEDDREFWSKVNKTRNEEADRQGS